MHRKWLIGSFLAVGLLPVLLLAVLLGYIATADLGRHRELISDHVSTILGRRLDINGALGLNPGSTTTLIIGDLSLANAAWSSEATMLSVRHFEIDIELLALLQGDIHIPRLSLDGVRAVLETNRRGQNNWALMKTEGSVSTARDPAAAGFKLPWLGDIAIGDVDLVYRDAASGRDVLARIDRATAKTDSPASPVALDVVALIDDHPLELNGRVVLPSPHLTDRLDVPVELHARILDLEADATGRISGSSRAPAIDVRFQAAADSLEQFRSLFGNAVPDVAPVQLTLRAAGEQGQPVVFVLDASAGKARLESRLTLRHESLRPRLVGELAISDVDVLRLWAPLFVDAPAAAVDEPAATGIAPGALGLEQPLQLDWLERFDADVALTAARINLPDVRIASLQSRVVIDDRLISVHQLDLSTDAGKLSAALSLDARNRPVIARLELETTALKLGSLPVIADNARFRHSRASAQLDLRATGDTPAQMIERAQGSVQLDYHDDARKEKLALRLNRESGQQAPGKNRLVLKADGSLDGQPIELRGHIIPPDGLLNGFKPYAVDLSLQAFGVSGTLAGSTALPYSLDGLDVNVQAAAKDLKGLRRAFGQDIPEIGKVGLQTRVRSQQSRLSFSQARLDLDQGHVHGRLVVDMAEPLQGLEAELELVDLDLDELQAAMTQPAPAQKTAVGANRDKVFSDEALPLDALTQHRIDVRLRAVNAEHNNRRLQEAEVRITIADGVFKASVLKLSAVKGDLVGDLVVDASDGKTPRVSLVLNAPHVEAGELIAIDDGTAVIEGPLAVDVKLEGVGASVAQIAGTLSGSVRLLMQQGRADAKALDLYIGGLSAMFGTMFAEDASRTRIECAICDLKLEQGVLTPQLAVLDTQYSTVITEGRVDLKQERLDLKVSPQAKGVTLSVAFPVLVKGTIRKPDVAVEKTGALLKAGELWATVVYPPTALLKFSDLGGGGDNPCVTLVAEKAGIPIIDGVGKVVKGTVKGTVKGVGGVVKGVGTGLGKLLEKGKDEADGDQAGRDIGADEADSGEDDDADLFMDY